MGVSRAIRTKFSLALLTSGILALVILPGVANGMSPNTFCGDQVGLEIISTGEFVNIIVPSPNDDDGRCMLTGDVLVTGNVKVNPGGHLEVTDGVEIEGNLQAKGAFKIYVGTVVGPIIGGNVQIGGSTEDVTIMGSSIGGDIKIKDQSAGIILIVGNDVGGSIKLSGNTALEINVTSNVVDVDIKLEGNEGTSTTVFAPIRVGGFNGGNVVGGDIILKDNLVSATGCFCDIKVERNIVDGNIEVEGNEVEHDDLEVSHNDVGGDIILKDNKADFAEDGGSSPDVDVEDNCMTGHGNILVENNFAENAIDLDGNGDSFAGADNACAAGDGPENFTVTGNFGGDRYDLEDNFVRSNYVIEDNILEDGDYEAFNNEVGGDYEIKRNTITGSGDFLINDNDVDGDIVVEDNTVRDELLCSGNDPDPIEVNNTFTTEDCTD